MFSKISPFAEFGWMQFNLEKTVAQALDSYPRGRLLEIRCMDYYTHDSPFAMCPDAGGDIGISSEKAFFPRVLPTGLLRTGPLADRRPN
jgi:hypothetical protein